MAVVALAAAACTPQESDPFDPTAIAPPPAGEGFQVATQDTAVPAGHEYQDCYFFRVGDLATAGGLPADEPARVHRITIAQKPGSHHFNIFRVRTIAGLDPADGPFQHGEDGHGACFDSATWADWPLVANSQQDGANGITDWTFPDGVAESLAPDEWLMLQTHYVNAATQGTPDFGKVVTNFWTMPAEAVTAEMGTLFATKQSIRICQSNPQPAFDGTCHFGSTTPVRIIGANGHFHSRGRQFDMYAWDGTSIDRPPESDLFYRSLEWDDPPMLHSPELDLPVAAGAGVWFTCAYRWTMPAAGCQALNDADVARGTPPGLLDCCYTFGPTVESSEHCNVFAYYYPKTDDIFCD